MELWHGDLPDFIKAAGSSELAEQMRRTFVTLHRRPPGESEYRSWEESLRAVAKVADDAATTDDVTKSKRGQHHADHENQEAETRGAGVGAGRKL